jgi:hypothetical protein
MDLWSAVGRFSGDISSGVSGSGFVLAVFVLIAIQDPGSDAGNFADVP